MACGVGGPAGGGPHVPAPRRLHPGQSLSILVPVNDFVRSRQPYCTRARFVRVRALHSCASTHSVPVHFSSVLPLAWLAFSAQLKLSVGRTCPFYVLEIEGLLTQGSRPGRTFGESVGGILEMDSSDWSNGIRHHVFDTRSDTEFKLFGPINHLRYVSDIRKLS